MYYTVGGFTLDDTILPTGEIHWSAPGGNALYSAIGAKLWGVDVGIIAPVGDDYPQEYLDQLIAAGFNVEGVKRVHHPSFHVWILHEGGGKRQIIYRLDSGRNVHLDPSIDDLPKDIEEAQGVHICPILGSSQAVLLEHLHQKEVSLFLDLIVIPDQIDTEKGHRTDLWKDLRCFLPSIEEVRAIFGDISLNEAIEKLCNMGIESFAIKMGHQGSVVRDSSTGAVHHIPAYPANVIDATGAGDAYCGGFMVGLQETGNPVEAALRGTIASSFVIEDFGALHTLHIPKDRAHDRLEYLRNQVRAFNEIDLTLGVK